MIDFLGSGALNLDLVYELENLEDLRAAGFDLHAGREISGNHHTAKALIHFLDRHGTIMAKSGGGSAANTICALSRLGHSAGFIGAAGKDWAGNFILNSMKDVDTSLIKQVGKNAVCVVIIDKIAHDRTMFVAPHDIEMDTPEPETLKSVLNTKVLHLSSLVQPHGIYIQEKLTDVLRQEQILSFDPGELYAAKGIKALSGILRRTDILFVTEEEVEIMTHMAGNIGLETIYSMLNSNRTRYNTSVGLNLFKYTEGPAIVYKKGAKGAAIYSPKVYTEMSAEKVLKIVDNTGAGDAFNAGFLNVMFQGASAVECLKSGIRLAAFSLSFFGREWLNRLENKKGR